MKILEITNVDFSLRHFLLPLMRALRVAGKVEPVFVEDVAELPQAVRDFARDGDVVIVMGAGSISRVPAQLGERA